MECEAVDVPIKSRYIALYAELFEVTKTIYPLKEIPKGESELVEGMWNFQVFVWPVHFLTFELSIIIVIHIGEEGPRWMRQIVSNPLHETEYYRIQSFDGWVL